MKFKPIVWLRGFACFACTAQAIHFAFSEPWAHGQLMVLRGSGIAVLFILALLRKSLALCTFAAMLAGAEFGYDVPGAAVHCQILATIFFRLVKLIIAPLLFGTLVTALAGQSDIRKLGRLGWRTVIYFEVVSTIALIIGAVAIQISRAGDAVARGPMNVALPDMKPPVIENIVANLFPENIASAVAEGQIPQIVVFSILFGVALALVTPTKRRAILEFAEGLSETMFKLTNMVMWVAPLGVFGAIAYTVAQTERAAALTLGRLLLTMYAALFVFIILVLLPVTLLVKVKLKGFIRTILKPVTIAFTTASSEAALPLAMEAMEAFGIDRSIVGFVLPTGYSLNLDGSSLYQALALFFVVQASGMHAGVGKQAAMLFTLLVSSKGTAGVARASLVVVLGVATSFHLPSAPLMLLLGIDQLMDMGRSGVNVLGNCLAAVVIARWQEA